MNFSLTTIRPRLISTPARGRAVVARAEPVNPDIRKDEPKVVDMYKAADLPKKVSGELRSTLRCCQGRQFCAHARPVALGFCSPGRH